MEEDVRENSHLNGLMKDLHNRSGHVSVNCDGCMLVWGGYQYSYDVGNIMYMPTDQVLIYDPIVTKWKVIATQGIAPDKTSGAGAVLLHNELFVFGGFCCKEESQGENCSDMYVLNVDTYLWRKPCCRGPLPLACDKMVAWSHKERVYFFGGFGLPPNKASPSKKYCNFCFDRSTSEFPARGWNNQLVAFDPRTESWEWPSCKGTPPCPRAAHTAAKMADKVYIFGGRNKTVRMNDLHCLDLQSMTWSGSLKTLNEGPRGRTWHSFTPISDTKVVLYGGFNQQNAVLNDCWILHVPTLKWEKVELPFMKPRMWHTACLGDPGELLIYGRDMENGNSTSPVNVSICTHCDKVSNLKVN